MNMAGMQCRKRYDLKYSLQEGACSIGPGRYMLKRPDQPVINPSDGGTYLQQCAPATSYSADTVDIESSLRSLSRKTQKYSTPPSEISKYRLNTPTKTYTPPPRIASRLEIATNDFRDVELPPCFGPVVDDREQRLVFDPITSMGQDSRNMVKDAYENDL